ncbi:STAS domain-containing protein [Streptomyces sp. CJ_13]|nr:STAS domain-containing protein [Streptomyces sp. CJ_13]
MSVTGELDINTCPRVTETTDALPLHGQTLLVHLSAVTFMDSAALNMLLRLRHRAHAEGGTLKLCGASDQTLQVLDITGTRSLFALSPGPAQETY